MNIQHAVNEYGDDHKADEVKRFYHNKQGGY